MYWLSVRFCVWWLRFVTFRGDAPQKLVTWGDWWLLCLSQREMPDVSTVKDNGLRSSLSLSITIVLPTPSAQSFLLHMEPRWQHQSLSVCSLTFPLYATTENWEKYSDSSRTSSSLMSLGGNKRNPLWTPLLVSVQFSHSVVSDSLWPHEPQHARPPCPSLTPRIHPNPCPSSQRCHPTISSSVVLFSSFSSCPQSSQHKGLFQWISSSHQVAKVLEFQLQHQSFQWIFRTDFL